VKSVFLPTLPTFRKNDIALFSLPGIPSVVAEIEVENRRDGFEKACDGRR